MTIAISGALRSFGNIPALSRNIVTLSHRQLIISTIIDNVQTITRTCKLIRYKIIAGIARSCLTRCNLPELSSNFATFSHCQFIIFTIIDNVQAFIFACKWSLQPIRFRISLTGCHAPTLSGGVTAFSHCQSIIFTIFDNV